MDYIKIPEGVKGKRIATRLLDLKSALQEENGVPSKNENSLLLATWNIREFDSRSYGERNIEPLYYIAEIISHFDLVAVQEVREDLKALEQVRDLLGGWWKYIATDVTEGTRGNRERMAFFYDSRKVKFGNVAGEVVIPPIEIRKSGQKTEFLPSNQLYRTPFLCGFKASWSKFMLCTVHILFGKNKADDPNRVQEIKQIATFLAKRSDEPTSWSENIILLGDFNIFDPKDVTMNQILSAGFEVPPELQNLPRTNTGSKKRYYDQIAFMPKDMRLQSTGNAGVFDFYNIVYRKEDQELYIDEMGTSYSVTSKGKQRTEKGKALYYKTYWRTYQMSDHLPMWVELKTDFGKEYLEDRK